MKPAPSTSQKLNRPNLQKYPRFDPKSSLSSSAKSEIKKSKKLIRSELSSSDWNKANYFASNICEELFDNCVDTIDRVKYKDFTISEFLLKYQQGNKPLIIQNVAEQWNANSFWNWDNFYKAFKKVKFKIGEDDDENTVRVKLKYFFEYMKKNRDDSPLYLFEKDIGDKKEYKPILKNYSVPKYFKDDLFNLLGQTERPPYQWFLIGPKRSGTTIHLDPLNTSAWNTSLHGYKLWILFPNDVPKWIANGRQFRGPNEDNEASDYFAKILPRLKASEGKENLRYIECVQRPGETIFVPGGWWHAVLNLSDTMAVTQNFCSHFNFDAVWKSFRISRKVLSNKFLGILKKRRNYLYDRAVDLNTKDKFKMKGKKGKPSEKDQEPSSSNTTTTLFSSSASTSSSSDSSSSSTSKN